MRDVIRFSTLALILSFLTPSFARAEEDRWFARDKALHAFAGTVLAAGGYAGGALVFETRGTRVASGLVVALGAGAAKEWWDRGHDGDPSVRDLAWDGVGAAAGVTIAWLIDRAMHRQGAQPAASRSRRARRVGLAEVGHFVELDQLPIVSGTLEGVVVPGSRAVSPQRGL